MEDYEIKETIIRTKMKDHMYISDRHNWKAMQTYQGIFDLLKRHPCPRYRGPFTESILGHWEYKTRLNSKIQVIPILSLSPILKIKHVAHALLIK